MNRELKSWEEELTNEEINKLAEWFEELTIAQLSFIKDSYTAMLQANAHEIGQNFVH
jgi:hypothetical protein